MAKSLGKRRNLAKDQRELEIKEAALKIFSAKGYHRTTMADIAMEAGYGKGTIYWYWKSKEQLYFALISHLHDEILALVDEAGKAEGTALEKIKNLADGMIDVYYRNREYCKLSWRMRAEEPRAFSPEYVQALHNYVIRTRRALETLLKQGSREGYFKGIDPYYLSCIILGTVEGMEIQWLEDQSTFDLRKGMDIALQLLASRIPGGEGS